MPIEGSGTGHDQVELPIEGEFPDRADRACHIMAYSMAYAMAYAMAGGGGQGHTVPALAKDELERRRRRQI